MDSRIVRLFKVFKYLKSVSTLQTHEITNHKSQKTKLFHQYYMTLFHDKFSHPEKDKNALHKHSKNKYLFNHFYFFRFISTQFADFASLQIQMRITLAKLFNVLSNTALSLL